MDVNEKKQAIEGLELVTVEKFVVPKDELKKFYLQEAVMHNSQGYASTAHNEHEMLCILQHDLQKEVALLTTANCCSWKDAISSAQKLIGNYLLQPEVDVKERQKINTDFTEVIQLLTLLASNRNYINKIQNMLYLHNKNVKKLLAAYSENHE